MSQKIYRRYIGSFVFLKITMIVLILTEIECKEQYVQPLNMGMQVAIPYDIANIFNRPVWFGRTLSIFLAFSVLVILFFGVITSPFGYMFGIPSEKYVMGQTWGSLSGLDSALKDPKPSRSEYISEFDANRRVETNHDDHYYEYEESPEEVQEEYEEPEEVQEEYEETSEESLEDLYYGYGASPRGFQESTSYSGDLVKSMFYWMPTVQDNECKKLVLCYGHRTFQKLPDAALKVFRFFSKRLGMVQGEFKEAILTGLESSWDEEEGFTPCEEYFPDCPDTVLEIVVRSAVGLMPKWTRKKALKPNQYF